MECCRRASKFAELKRKRSEEKQKEADKNKILQSDDLWEELGTVNIILLAYQCVPSLDHWIGNKKKQQLL